MLRAGVMEQGAVRRSNTGTPQGGVISPLLANIYLDRLDRDWQTRGRGRLVRYADDLVVVRPKEAKTRIVHLREGGEGFDFLGFHHRYVRGRTPRSRHLTFLVAGPHARRCSTPAIGSIS